MSVSADVSHVSLKIDGQPAPPDALADLLELTVDHSLHLPSMFTLRLHSHDLKWLENGTFREGKTVEVLAGERPPVKLLSGKIAVLEPELGEGAPTLLVRGYDLSHKLYRGRARRSFTQVTDSDLARQLAAESGLRPGTIDSTSEVHEYVFQNNQSNAELLLDRARRLGYELWVEDDALNFRRPAPNGEPVQLAWAHNLREFRLRLSTSEQVNEVEVRGWNPKQKREVVGQAQRGDGAPQIGLGRPGADVARQAWGEAKVALIDQFVASPAEADVLAQATLDELSSTFVEAEGICDANPQLVPGRQVKITGVGQRFSGTYYVTRVLHEWTKNAGLQTHFTVGGRRDRGIWSLLEETAPRSVGLGLVIGIVTDNRDPEEMARVRVRFPWMSDQIQSAWARMIAPMAGAGRGFLTLPEIDDEVLVGFEHGDIHRPFVMGALWNGQDHPPLQASAAVGGDGKVNQRIFKSRAGHTILLDDTSGSEEITIVDKTGQNKIVFHSANNSMEILVQGDLTIEAGGKITMKGSNGVEVESQKAFTVSAQTGAEVTSQTNLKLSAQTGINVESQAQLRLSGQTSAELTSPLQAKVSGALVEISGTGPVQVTGTPIQLN